MGGRSVTYRQDGLITPPVLHLTLFDPIDDHYGFAPLSAAQVALDVHNAASSWNKALLDNAARQEMPGQLYETYVGEIEKLAKNGDTAAIKCLKLFGDNQFRKDRR